MNGLVQAALAALPGRASGGPDVLSEAEMARVVDAVLAALREPTDAMLVAAEKASALFDFRDMIDVARAELVVGP